MKNRLITGIIFIILGLLIALGPITVFPICEVCTADQLTVQRSAQGKMMSDSCNVQASGSDSSMTSPMKCFWTARAELGIGFLISVAGLLLVLLRRRQARFGLTLALGLNGILALLIPLVLIGVCSDAQSSCRVLALPALSILSSFVIVLSVINAIYLYKTEKKGSAGNETQTTDNQPDSRE